MSATSDAVDALIDYVTRHGGEDDATLALREHHSVTKKNKSDAEKEEADRDKTAAEQAASDRKAAEDAAKQAAEDRAAAEDALAKSQKGNQ